MRLVEPTETHCIEVAVAGAILASKVDEVSICLSPRSNPNPFVNKLSPQFSAPV